MTYIDEHSDVKKKDFAEKFIISTKTLSDVNVIKAEEKLMQVLASGSDCAEETSVLATRIETLLSRKMPTFEPSNTNWLFHINIITNLRVIVKTSHMVGKSETR